MTTFDDDKHAANCKKMLDSTNATEHDDELFCRSCYGKKFGPKGYGYGGGGAGVLSMDDGTGYIVPIFTLLLFSLLKILCLFFFRKFLFKYFPVVNHPLEKI